MNNDNPHGPVLSVFRPKAPLPLVFDSPHSGHHYPDDFNFACDFITLQRTEDKYVDDLFTCVPDLGGVFLCAHAARSYIDLNRAVTDIDPELLSEEWPFGPVQPSARSDAGIGLIRRLVKPGIPVYDRDLSPEEVIHRIEKYYRPYHDTLKKLLDEAHYNFGKVWHINCHSMPAASAAPRTPIGLVGGKPKQSDFVLGDRDGASGDMQFTHALREFLKELGYTVTVNDPFKGVELVRRYSNPTRGRYALQVEINKALFMNEETNEKSKDYSSLKEDIGKMVAFIASFVESQLIDLAAD
jgi:N-formylglutamate deformylase